MNAEQFRHLRKTIDTDFGHISYVEQGQGPVALFVHGALLNGYQWRHQLTGLADIRRIIAPDSLGMGYTEMRTDAGLGMKQQASMLRAFIDALDIEKVDVVGNNSGGGAVQIFAANNPERIRTMTLTNCEVQDHDEEVPVRANFRNLMKSGQIVELMQTLIDNPHGDRSGFTNAYQFPDALPDDVFETYFAPLIQSPQRIKQMTDYIFTTTKNDHLEVEDKIKAIAAPTLVLWGLADQFFPVQWAHWLRDNLANVVEVMEIADAKLFWPEEKPELLNQKLREFWQRFS